MGKIKLPIDIDPAALLRDLELQRCERSLAYFIRQAWPQIEPGQPYVHNWHVDMICEHLEAITNGVEIGGKPYNRLLINVPPGTMKSLLLNVFWPAWEWGPRNMPHLRYVCAAHKVENLSARDSRRMRQLITSDWYQGLWGSRVSLAKDQNEKLNFVNSANGFRIATAITSLTGIRGDRVLCFPYDEVVHTEYGKLKIGDMVKSKIKVKVFSSLPGSNVVELKEILDWKKNPGSPIVEVGLSDGSTFRCTPDHRVWTSSGWVEAASLNPSHVLPSMTAADAAEIADTVEPFKAGDRFPVFVRQIGHAENTFCLEVEDNHTFFVGKGNGVLVSNCDDPHSVDSAISEVQRQAEVSNFLEAIPTRLTNPLTSAIVVIMQRLHEDDVSGAILDNKLGYDHVMLPMRYDKRRAGPTMLGTIDPREEDGELLFPERFPEEVVARDERAMGPYATASQFQQEPAPRGGGIIKDDWWQLWIEAEFPPMDFILASLDTAYTTKQENDYSALTVWGVFTSDTKAKITKTMTRYGTVQQMERIYDEGAPSVMLMYAFQERLEFPDLLKKVSTTCKNMKVDKLIIENKAAGISLAQELRRSFSIEDYGIQLVDPKGGDKLARLYSVQHLFSEGMIWAPDKEWSEMVIRQTSSFPKGKHDDLVDSLSQGLRHLREAGLLTRSIERIAEIDRSKVYRGGKPPPLYPA